MDIKKVLKELEAASGRRNRPSRSNRTLALREPQTRVFYNYCKFKGWYVQDVVDLLVQQFLDEVASDLPPDPQVKDKKDGAA